MVFVYGGIDIVVNNVGFVILSLFDEISLKEWNFNMNVLGIGYFFVVCEVFK